ncbi:MAG: hypothetical protein BGO67_06215 [Alphaproteobacteria bacterium 41-28]|nr:MAG: hypothetical protein BGO67_06215 [Alphaproteobacteria bacterium 41-28]
MSEEYSLSFFTWHTRESTDKINQALEAFRPCKPYVSDRYKEAISFPNGGEMTQLSLKASKALERNTLGRLLFSGVLKFDERP